MPEEKKAVEQDGKAAAAEVKEGVDASITDPEAEITALREKLSKTERDRDNYRNATLALKGKKDMSELDLSDPTQLGIFIENKVQERLSQSESEKTKNDLESLTTRLSRENKELKLALSSKKASTSIAGGSSSGSGVQTQSEVKQSYWSKEQEEALRKRISSTTGLKGDALEAAVKRAADLAQSGQANAPISR